MVRVYKRKSARGQYGMDNLHAAIAKVSSGEMSKRKAEAVFGVPRKTLTRHLKGQVKVPGSLGRFKPALGNDYEKALVDHAIALQQMLFGLTTTDFRKLAFDIAEKLGLPHPFNKDDKMAGKDWLASFLARHPELSVRHPEPTSMSRATAFNKPSVDKFFRILKDELVKHNVTADRLWNADESGLTVVHKPGRIMAKLGQKQVGKITSAEKGQTTTVMCAVNAAGSYLPPMMIFKRKRMSELLLKGTPHGTIGATSENGWIESELFVKWLQHFVHHVQPSVDRKVLLVLDGHASHKSLAAIDYARENSVVMVCLPPHSTHHLQPLDRTVFGPLKTAYNSECDKWMVRHPGRRISQYDIGELFNEAYLKAASMKNAVSGFASSGLWPFNPDIFTDEHFAASLLTEEPQPDLQSSQQPTDQPPAQQNDQVPPEQPDQSACMPQISRQLAKDVITELSPIPRAEKTRTRKRRAESAEVVTGSPYKKMLMEKMSSGKKQIKTKNVAESIGQKKKKETKKLTCRLDRPKARACGERKNNQLSKRTIKKDGKKATAKRDMNTNMDKDKLTCFCGEVFSEPPTEPWIQCNLCKGWYHEACSAGEDIYGFTCDNCL